MHQSGQCERKAVCSKDCSTLQMAAFESVVLNDLENHLVLSRKRRNTVEAQKEEIEGNSRIPVLGRRFPELRRLIQIAS